MHDCMRDDYLFGRAKSPGSLGYYGQRVPFRMVVKLFDDVDPETSVKDV